MYFGDRRILAPVHHRFEAHRRLRQSGGAEQLVQARADIHLRAGKAQSFHHAARNTLNQQIRCGHRHHPRFLKGEDPVRT